MNNLPSNLTRHTVFRDNDYSHTLVFPDEYVLPAVSEMQMQVRKNGVIVPDVEAEITKNGQRVTFAYTAETLQLIPGFHKQYFVMSGKSLLGGELEVIIGVGEQDITESVITVVDEQITVVVVQGLALVAEQVALAEEQVALAMQQVVLAEQYTSVAVDAANNSNSSAGTATTQAGIATLAATAAGNSATAAQTAETNAEAARDIAVSVTSDPRPATFADIPNFIESGVARTLTVQNDELQGIEQVPYYWNGYKLFVYGVPVADEDQPQPV
jgi:hypothetical protein